MNKKRKIASLIMSSRQPVTVTTTDETRPKQQQQQQQQQEEVIQDDSSTNDHVPFSFVPRFFSTQPNNDNPNDHDVNATELQYSDDIAAAITTTATSPADGNRRWCHPQYQPHPCNPNNNYQHRSDPQKPSKFSTHHHHHIRRTHGPRMQRLQRIRDTIREDQIRFSSGQYPCTKMMRHSIRGTDRNDPRYRAKTVLDVTILPPPIRWKTASDAPSSPSFSSHPLLVLGGGGLVVLPCFIHHWSATTTNSSSSLVSVVPPTTTTTSSSSTRETSIVPQQQNSFIMFTNDTIQQQNIVPGFQLRIYNAIYIPIPEQPPVHGSNPVRRDMDGVIVGTQLCEPYPRSILPPLLGLRTE
jgi:hypothetical protein